MPKGTLNSCDYKQDYGFTGEISRNRTIFGLKDNTSTKEKPAKGRENYHTAASKKDKKLSKIKIGKIRDSYQSQNSKDASSNYPVKSIFTDTFGNGLKPIINKNKERPPEILSQDQMDKAIIESSKDRLKINPLSDSNSEAFNLQDKHLKKYA